VRNYECSRQTNSMTFISLEMEGMYKYDSN